MSKIPKSEAPELFAKMNELIFGENPQEKDVAKMTPEYVYCLGFAAIMDRNKELEERVSQLEALINP